MRQYAESVSLVSRTNSHKSRLRGEQDCRAAQETASIPQQETFALPLYPGHLRVGSKVAESTSSRSRMREVESLFALRAVDRQSRGVASLHSRQIQGPADVVEEQKGRCRRSREEQEVKCGRSSALPGVLHIRRGGAPAIERPLKPFDVQRSAADREQKQVTAGLVVSGDRFRLRINRDLSGEKWKSRSYL